jgi:uncharacterized protein
LSLPWRAPRRSIPIASCSAVPTRGSARPGTGSAPCAGRRWTRRRGRHPHLDEFGVEGGHDAFLALERAAERLAALESLRSASVGGPFGTRSVETSIAPLAAHSVAAGPAPAARAPLPRAPGPFRPTACPACYAHAPSKTPPTRRAPAAARIRRPARRAGAGDGPLDALIAALPDGPALGWYLAAVLAGGLARGFSGFGSALIIVPLGSAALGPQVAVPAMLVLEALAIALLTPGAWRVADRREAGWLAVGLVLGTPLGAAILAVLDPVPLRWGVAAVILGMLALLVSGWRLRGGGTASAALGVGAVGGVLGGVAMVAGPPAIAYLLGRGLPAREMRAAITVYLAAGGLCAGIAFAATGLLNAALLPVVAVGLPTYAIGIAGGVRLFGLASEATFRHVCYAMIAVSALLSLPLWDGVLR